MKKMSFLFVSCLLGLVLAGTNPKDKGNYTSYVAEEFQSLCCRVAPEAAMGTCKKLRPLTTQVVKRVLSVYTDIPRDYVFLTRYTTHLPGYTVYGIGLGGQFVVWPQKLSDGSACDILYNTLFSRQ